MSSVSKPSKGSFWQANFRDHSEKRLNRSTRIPSTRHLRSLAESISAHWEKISRREYSREKLAKYSEMIADDIITKLNCGEDAPSVDYFRKKTAELLDQFFPPIELEAPSFREVASKWLDLQKLQVKATSYTSYNQAIREFIKHLGKKADLGINEFNRDWLRDFQRIQAGKVTNKTANKKVKRVCSVLRWAYRDDIVEVNHSDKIKHLPEKRNVNRRPFTKDELKALLAVANQEWKSMIYAGYGTGQRLGDIALMSWKDINLDENLWKFTSMKTGRKSELPLLSDVTQVLLATKKSGRRGYVHPVAATHYLREDGYSSATLSNQFAELLFKAGLKKARVSHRSKQTGRKRKRAPVGLGFHCLRYTTATMLHELGASQSIAQEIIGHNSAVVHAIYVKPRLKPIRTQIEKLSLSEE